MEQQLGPLEGVAIVAAKNEFVFINASGQTLEIPAEQAPPWSSELTYVGLDYPTGLLFWSATLDGAEVVQVLDLRSSAGTRPSTLLTGTEWARIEFLEEDGDVRVVGGRQHTIVRIASAGVELKVDPKACPDGPCISLDESGTTVVAQALGRPPFRAQPTELQETTLPERVAAAGRCRHCGDAIELPGTGMLAVRVKVVQDLCHILWQLYDPATSEFIDPRKGQRSKRPLKLTEFASVQGCGDGITYTSQAQFLSYENVNIMKGYDAVCVSPRWSFEGDDHPDGC